MPDSPETVFIDANVLLYLASADERKITRVEAILAQGGTVSVQILNEIANVARRKMKMGWGETIAFVERFRLLLTVVPLTEQIHEDGLRLAERYQLSVYDGMVVAAALDSGCSVLLSEDMHHGLKIEDRLEICNPFV
jgi:predicted nucleic acid-binding protein